jgi:hypothetical protein
MHEVYECQPGSYENVYINFREFGMRTTKWDIDGERKGVDVRGGPKPAPVTTEKGEKGEEGN